MSAFTHRPITWLAPHRGTDFEGKPYTIRRGKMPLVTIVGTDRPHHIVIREARWQIAADGTPRLTFTVENLSDKPQVSGGCDLHIEKERNYWGMTCASVEDHIVIPTQLRVDGDKLSAAAGDPDFKSDQIQTTARLDYDECLEPDRLMLAIPSLGTLPPGPSRVRYAIQITGGRRSSDVQAFVAKAPLRFLRVYSDLIFPYEVRVHH